MAEANVEKSRKWQNANVEKSRKWQNANAPPCVASSRCVLPSPQGAVRSTQFCPLNNPPIKDLE